MGRDPDKWSFNVSVQVSKARACAQIAKVAHARVQISGAKGLRPNLEGLRPNLEGEGLHPGPGLAAMTKIHRVRTAVRTA